jgi:hypothetical protein
MIKTNENRSGINAVLLRARIYNSEIGNYQEHFIDDNFNYAIRLSNGRITIPITMAQDQEKMPISINEERIQTITNNFINTNPKPIVKSISKIEVQDLKTENVKLSFWQKLFSLFGMK